MKKTNKKIMNSPIRVIKIIINTIVALGICGVALLFLVPKAEFVEEQGMVIPSNYYNVYAPAMGEIKKVYKDFGDRLSKDELILEIDKKELEKKFQENNMTLNTILSSIKSKEIELENINKEKKDWEIKIRIMNIGLENMKQELENIRFLAAKGEKSSFELKRAEMEIKKQELEVSSYKNNDSIKMKEQLCIQDIENLKTEQKYYQEKAEEITKEIEKTIVKAEHDNLIVITPELKELKGAMVNKGTLICTLADLSSLKMIVALKENEIGKVKVGQKAIIFIDSIPYEKFTTLEGNVIRLYPQAKGDNTYDKVELEIKGFSQNIKKEKLKEINLKTGLKGKARIMIKKEKVMIRYIWDKLFE